MTNAHAAPPPPPQHAPGSIISLGVDPGLRSTGIGAVERRMDGTYRSLGVRVSRTEPTKEKSFTLMRTSNDDQRRIREHHAQIAAALKAVKPHCMGIENYTVYEPTDVNKIRVAADELVGLFGGTTATLDLAALRALFQTEFLGKVLDKIGRLAEAVRGTATEPRSSHAGLGQAAKTIAVYGVALAAAWAEDIPVFVFQPADLKKRFTGQRSASKAEVERGVAALVEGFDEALQLRVPQRTLREHAADASGHAVHAADEYARLKLDLGPAAVPAW